MFVGETTIMASKRSIEFVEMSAAKRRLLDNFVRELGLDEGRAVDDGDGPYPFANLPRPAPVTRSPSPGYAPGPATAPVDALPVSGSATGSTPMSGSAPSPFPGSATAPVNARPVPEPTPSPFPGPAPGSSTPPVYSYPRQSMERSYPLTKSRSKQIKIGMDVTSFSPYILLQGEHKKNMFSSPCVPISTEEFQVPLSDEIYSHILNALESNTPIAPLIVGDLNLSLMINKTNKNFRSVVFEHKDFSIKIHLGLSSWKMLKNAKEIMNERLIKVNQVCQAASLNFPSLLNAVKQALASHGFYSEVSIKSLSFEKFDQIISASFEFCTSPFPEVLKKELICFHSDILREKLIASLQR